MTLYKSFLQSENGNIATIFAFAAIPLLLTIGVAIDKSRISSYHSKMQDTADAAALHAALAFMEDGKDAMEEAGHESFAANVTTIDNLTYTAPQITATDKNTVTISAQGSFKPMFPQLFGYPKLEFDVVSEAALSTPGRLEIAIAFDSTNSMSFDTRWENSISTVEKTLEDMKSFSGQDNFYLTLVPFEDRVNLGAGKTDWITGDLPADWEGCVEPRMEPSGIPDDEDPSNEMFVPSIPKVPFKYSSIEVGCPAVEITGPTNSVDQIVTAVNQMQPGGTGRFDVGLAWAWRTLSPNWRGEWGASNYPSNDELKVRKKIIFVSDGNSDASHAELDNERSWKFNQGSVGYFENFVELCQSVKGDNIEIYMVHIQGNPHAESYFQQCASSEQHYYLVDDIADIEIPVTDIRNELVSELRIIR